MNIQKVEDLFANVPFKSEMIREFRRIAAVGKPPLEIVPNADNESYEMYASTRSFLFVPGHNHNKEWLSCGAYIELLRQGPKLARPTPEQEETLENINVDLDLNDFAMPFPVLCVLLNNNPLYKHVVMWRINDFSLITVAASRHEMSEVSAIVRTGQPLEYYLNNFDDTLNEQEKIECKKAERVAINMCLALTNFGCMKQYLLPKERERDAQLAREKSERGQKAAKRLESHLEEVVFDREIQLRGTPSASSERGEPTGRERDFGWVRGHWRMQVHGPNRTLRKRILIKPYMVRADKLVGDLSSHTTTYKG